VIDSVAALVPKAELEGEMGDSHMGLQARLMSQASATDWHRLEIKNLHGIYKSDSREDRSYVYNQTTTGGRALKFYVSASRCSTVASIKDGDSDEVARR
jgi:RecA/RadA recombinase